MRLPQVVITVHGVESRGQWQDQIHPELTGIDDFYHYPHNYGPFRFWKILVPSYREKEIRRFARKYGEIRDCHPGVAPSVIAHSFGTYIISQALIRYPSIEFDRLILCGSVIGQDYDWRSLVNNSKVRRIRNEVAKNDPVVRLFRYQWLRNRSIGAGPSGLDGFNGRCEQLEQLRFEFTHSDYFVTNDHCRAFWIPFLRRTEDLVALCKRCKGEGEDAKQANKEFDLEYGPRIEHAVTKIFYYRSPSTEQIRDFYLIVRELVLHEGLSGRMIIDQLIEKMALALEEATRRR